MKKFIEIGNFVKFCNSVWLIINITKNNSLILQNQANPVWSTVASMDSVEVIQNKGEK